MSNPTNRRVQSVVGTCHCGGRRKLSPGVDYRIVDGELTVFHSEKYKDIDILFSPCE